MDYPLLIATRNNNIEIVNFIMDYAVKHNIKLDINGRDKSGLSPFL